jgi:hypothetical protein
MKGKIKMTLIENFKTNIFNPSCDDSKQLPDTKGLYIITANNLYNLPECMWELQYKFLLERPIIYIGISNKSLRKRDYKNHFNGNARVSTLRKSLGSLMKYTKSNEGHNHSTKYKFIKPDEEKLSAWMKNNLFLHYYVSDDTEMEKSLINEFNPPLNLEYNNPKINPEFRKLLSNLRKYSPDNSLSHLAPTSPLQR